MRRKKIPERIRQFVARRAHFLCEYCLIPMSYVPDPFDVEHTLPLSKGGTNDPENLAHACGGCNGHKSNLTESIDPADNKLVRLYNPRLDTWADHFAWNEVFTQMVGLTPIGRATILALHLNRPALLNLRSLLLAFGEHPPLH